VQRWNKMACEHVTNKQSVHTTLNTGRQETVSRSGISWVICKSAPRPRHITTPASYHSVFSARCNIYISCLCYDVSFHLSVTEVHWRIIANLGFKFQSQFTTHCSRRAAYRRDGRKHRREEWRDHLALC